MNPPAATGAWRLVAAAVAALVLAPAPALAWAVATAAPARAHDALVGATPGDGDHVDALPSQVVLKFSEEALEVGTAVRVEGPDGDVTDGDVEVSGATVRQGVDGAGTPGTYTVVWRVTSADGHPVSGTFDFTVDEGATTAPATTADPGTATATSGADGATPDPTVSTSAPAAVVADGGPSDGGASAPGWWLGAAVAAVVVAAVVVAVAVRRPARAAG